MVAVMDVSSPLASFAMINVPTVVFDTKQMSSSTTVY
jgi:hypothetical protein